MNIPDQHDIKDQQRGPQVIFEHVNSLTKAKFKADWDDLLSALWDTAYNKLTEPRRQDDHLQSADGTDLMGHLGLTLRQAQERKLLKGHHFQIVGPTGGASA